MTQEIEIPEGYEVKIDGNKVIFVPKESEDEKIRKEIINYLNFAESHNLLRAADCGKKKGWLAYLEKQKEPNYSPLCNTINDKIREYIANHFIADTVVKTDMKSIVKAMEEGVRLGMEEQKPAEWSEEDEALIENVCTALKGYALHERKVNLDEHAHRLEEMSERLKSIRLHPKQKRHLGMKDQWCCNAAWAAVRDSDAYNAEEKQFILNFLQRCEFQPHWKPSEEQMRAVFDASERNDKLGFVLSTLYNDLKKL